MGEQEDCVVVDNSRDFQLRQNTDPSPHSPLTMSLLNGAGARYINHKIALKQESSRKRKSEDIQDGERASASKRPRQDPALAINSGDMLTSTINQNVNMPTDPRTQDTTSAAASANVYEVSVVTNLPMKDPPLESTITTNLGSTATVSATNTTPAEPLLPALLSSPRPQLLSENIMLARIPGSSPLQSSTIAKACEWFSKLLTDGNGVDMMEIKKTLGIRIYREEELPTYQQLRKQVAQEQAQLRAQELAATLDESVKMRGGGSNVKTDKWRHSAVEECNNKTDNKDAYKAPKLRSQDATRNADGNKISGEHIGQTSNGRNYSLRLKLKRPFSGNQHYASDGRPKTKQARRKLEAKDAANEDVIRVYE